MSDDYNQVNDTNDTPNDESGSLRFEDEEDEVALMSKLFDLQKIEQHLSSQVSYMETVVTNLRREASMQDKLYADLREKNEHNEVLDKHLTNLQEASIHASCSREKQEILARYKRSSISVVPKTESEAYKEYKILKANLVATQAEFENSDLNIKVVDMEKNVHEHEEILALLELKLTALKKIFYFNEAALETEYNTMVLETVKVSMDIYNNTFKTLEFSKELSLNTSRMCETIASINEAEITMKILTEAKELSATPPFPVLLLEDIPSPTTPYPELPIRFMLSQPSNWNNITETDTANNRIIEENSFCEPIVTSRQTENMETTFQNMSFIESENNYVVENHETENASGTTITSESTANLTVGIDTVAGNNPAETIQQQYYSSNLLEIEDNSNYSRRLPTVTNTPKNSRDKEMDSKSVKLKQRPEVYESSPRKRGRSEMSDFLQAYNENNFSKMSGSPRTPASKTKPEGVLKTPAPNSKPTGILKTPVSNAKSTGILKTPVSNSKSTGILKISASNSKPTRILKSSASNSEPTDYNQDRKSYHSEKKSQSQRYTNDSAHRMEISNSQKRQKRQQSQSNVKVVESTAQHLQVKKQLYFPYYEDKTNGNSVAQQVKKHHSQSIPERTESSQKKKCLTQISTTNKMSNQPPLDPSRYQREEPVRKKIKTTERKSTISPKKQQNVTIEEKVSDEGCEMEQSFENILEDHNQSESESCLVRMLLSDFSVRFN